MTPGRILLIEDEVDLARLFEYALTRRGYAVRRAKDAETGLKAVRQWKPNLILLDLVLPGMSGHEFLVQLRKTSAVKVIVISGQHGAAPRQLALKLGANDTLLKPFTLEELGARVERALAPAPPRRRAEKAG